MKDDKNLDIKYIQLVERMKSHAQVIDETQKKADEVRKHIESEADEMEKWFGEKGGEERRHLALLSAQISLSSSLYQLILILLRDNLSLMAGLVSIVSGQREVKISVKRNIAKALKEWSAAMEAAKKAQEAYIK